MDRALDVFNEIQETDICLWNSVISILAIHGRGKEAQIFFSRLLETSTSPDSVTFLSVLSACRHSGLVEEGRKLFNLMNDFYGFKPTLRGLQCSNVGALLEASARLGNISMGEYAAKHLMEIDPNDSMCYVSLSNLYSREGRWEDAVRIRKLMSICGMEKVSGCSSVKVGSVVNEFSVGRGLNSIDEKEES
ncbi:Pentatricopeptide repeat-containing protein [Dendrobium catenatum]|uniref:Pentatricopeptide repeat-containing protein n=2 Tax=Dendrobium catenatum TaxID=906689 RepID=A0A2I0V6T1_9ASPA|nr:Pentatricopeptide repeat-containing protein [Dendrobium catenatum]